MLSIDGAKQARLSCTDASLGRAYTAARPASELPSPA